MRGRRGNNLIVIENGQMSQYTLDDKIVWEIGRQSKNNFPDINLHSTTVSRRHGKFQNMDGVWFYVDYNGKNGTVYNRTHIEPGLNGRVKPVILSDGDILVFGGGTQSIVTCKTIWAMFLDREFDEEWQTVDTKGMLKIKFVDGSNETILDCPEKGTVIEKENGMAIYMGDISFVIGNMTIQRD